MEAYNKDIKEVLKSLDSNLEGISSKEAEKRINAYGENIIEEAKKKSKLRRFLDQFNDMMIIILIIVVKLDSKGPVFFRQERVGKDKKLFHIGSLWNFS